MGSVYAKERVQELVHVPFDRAPLDGRQQSARVDAVHIKGIHRTHEDVYKPIVSQLFKVSNIQELLYNSHVVREKLEALECFSAVEASIDVSKGVKASPHGYEVTLNVKEFSRIGGAVHVAAGNDEGSIILGMRMPNLAGRAEKLQAEYTHSNKNTTNMQFSFIKPLLHRNMTWKSNLFQGYGTFLNSGYNETDRGCTTALEFQSAPKVRHILEWNFVWRELSCINRQVPFIIREYSGHSLKSSIIHSFIIDRRLAYKTDLAKIFPTSGNLLEVKTELAGLGGDVGFLKNELKIESYHKLSKDFTLQASFQAGNLSEFHDDKKVSICDKFFLGGPLSIRGFELRGVGPQRDGYALGSELYWAAGLHLYGPLPFRVFEKYRDYLRSHLFVNTGNTGKFDSGRDYRDFFKQMIIGTRLSCGVGVSVRVFNAARLEFNYCVPISLQPGDRAAKGFQIGIGMQFL